MDKCYLCGNKFNSSTVRKHGEHVIQQAIGGVLTQNNILCSSCGNRLGEEVDKPFCDIFKNITAMLDIKKDRKANQKKAIRGTIVSDNDAYGINLKGTGVIWKNFEVTPVSPTHRYNSDESKVIIYATKKQSLKYKNIVERELNEKFSHNKPQIIFCEDIDCIIDFSFPMNDQDFRRGLAKIAIGFASTKGILREDMPQVLEIMKDNSARIKKPVKLLQFYPLGIIDSEIEDQKTNIRYFPTHTLILFNTRTSPSKLVCYIELFSTFQWYVIIDDDYKGEPIYEYHYQLLEKERDFKFEPGRRYHKERNMFLGNLGISEDRIQRTYEKSNKEENSKPKYEIEYDIIQEEMIKQKYSVEFENEIKMAVDHASKRLMKHRINKNNLSVTENVFENLCLFYPNGNENEDFDITSYRRLFSEDGKRMDYFYALRQHSYKEPGKMKEYSFSKFEMLSKYTQKSGVRKKFS